MNMDKIAAEAAHKIYVAFNQTTPKLKVTEQWITERIQSALSQSLAARDKEIEAWCADMRRRVLADFMPSDEFQKIPAAGNKLVELIESIIQSAERALLKGKAI